jgi:aminoglycoside/choline kinase family phosphotransferase
MGDALATYLGKQTDPARMKPLAGDASARRYFRLLGDDGTTLVVMDCAAEPDTLARFIAVGGVLEHLGITVPRVESVDAGAARAAIEDFGDARVGRLIDEGGAGKGEIPGKTALYALATDVLIRIHEQFKPGHHDSGLSLPRYDAALFASQASLVAETLLPALTGKRPSESAVADLVSAFETVLARAEDFGISLLLRDYHADNLMYLPHRQGVAKCGVIDFQDAGTGPRVYDLVSLLQDARRDVGAEIEKAMISRYLARFPSLPREGFEESYNAVAAQRHMRILAVFTRLARERGKPQYLAFMPRVWRQLLTALEAPALVPVRDWMEKNLGAENFGKTPS